MESCNLDDGTVLDTNDSEDDGDMANGFGGVSSDEDNHDNKRSQNFSVRTGVLDEKAAATQALGVFALHTKASFTPYPLLLSIYFRIVAVCLKSQYYHNLTCE